jgi:hypothetical protein
MNSSIRCLAAAVAVSLLVPATALPQTFELVGTRAAGMGGAFVAVADDSSAVYWNPAGLATASYFSLVLNHVEAKAHDQDLFGSGSQSATFLSVAMPALGLTYYRLRSTQAVDLSGPGQLDSPPILGGPATAVASLVTHHTGVTLVQSLTGYLAVGTTLKLVRGIAARGFVASGDREEILDDAGDLIGRAETKFDADIGVMATVAQWKFGVTARNVAEHEFDVAGDGVPLVLHRQIRAGASVVAATGLTVSADMDLQSVPGTTGEVRNFAAGAEARVTRSAWVRGGFRFNTKDDQPAGHAPVGTVGGSYAVWGSLLVEGHAAWGGEAADRGWGLGARVVF